MTFPVFSRSAEGQMWFEITNRQEERLAILATSDLLQSFHGELGYLAIRIAVVVNDSVFCSHSFLAIATTLRECIVSPALAAQYCGD